MRKKTVEKRPQKADSFRTLYSVKYMLGKQGERY